MERETIAVQPIADDDAAAVARFLHENLSRRVAVARWDAILDPPWQVEAPNHGFKLVQGSKIVGVYVAVYSERQINGNRLRFCNLAAFCVLAEYRAHSFRLLRAMLGQRGFEFTDLSPSGNVVALNQRLGFAQLDGATRLVFNFPSVPGRRFRVSGDRAVIERTVSGLDAEVYRDHRNAPAARHVVAIADGEYGYLMVRKDRRKRLPFFASPLWAGGNRDVLVRAWPQIRSHLLLRHGALATLAEQRVLGFAPPHGFDLQRPRVKMFRSSTLSADAVDYLYSELTLLEW